MANNNEIKKIFTHMLRRAFNEVPKPYKLTKQFDVSFEAKQNAIVLKKKA